VCGRGTRWAEAVLAATHDQRPGTKGRLVACPACGMRSRWMVLLFVWLIVSFVDCVAKSSSGRGCSTGSRSASPPPLPEDRLLEVRLLLSHRARLTSLTITPSRHSVKPRIDTGEPASRRALASRSQGPASGNWGAGGGAGADPRAHAPAPGPGDHEEFYAQMEAADAAAREAARHQPRARPAAVPADDGENLRPATAPAAGRGKVLSQAGAGGAEAVRPGTADTGGRRGFMNAELERLRRQVFSLRLGDDGAGLSLCMCLCAVRLDSWWA
jgi:hypothetical protein